MYNGYRYNDWANGEFTGLHSFLFFFFSVLPRIDVVAQ